MKKTFNSSTSENSNRSNIINRKQNVLNRSLLTDKTNSSVKDLPIPSTTVKPKSSVNTYTSTPLVKDKMFNCHKYPKVVNNSYTIKYSNSISKSNCKPGRSIHDSTCKLLENKSINNVLRKIPKSVHKTNNVSLSGSNKKNQELNNLRRRLSIRFSGRYVKNKSASRLLEFDKNLLEIKTSEHNDQTITNNFKKETIQEQLSIKCNINEEPIHCTPEVNPAMDESKENVLKVREKTFNIPENENRNKIDIESMKTNVIAFHKENEKDMLRFKKLIEIQKQIVEHECKKLDILAQIFQLDEEV